MKFNIGDKLHISGDITVTGANKCGDGIYSYSTEVGTFHEPALDKLVCKTASVKPQDKPKFKVGDKAKIIGNSGNPRHFFEVGQIVNIGEVHQRYKGEWCARCTRRDGEQNINFCDLEPYAEHAEAPAPVKLYCVKDFMSGDWFTKGKVYETNQNDQFTTDSGYHPDRNEWDDNWTLGVHTHWSDHLVPLVSRPAKPGEWVLIVSPYYTSSEKDYTKGAIYKVLSPYSDGVCINNDHGEQTNIYHSEYLTLDGYDGRYETQEPKYWSGKVVCVETHDDFTVGKVYTFKDGKVNDNQGVKRPMTDYHAKTLEKWNGEYGGTHARFIEYKGEVT